MSQLCGSSSAARLKAAIAPGMSSALSRWRPSMNCAYASPDCADGSAEVCAGADCAASGAAPAARRDTLATRTATLIRGELFHKSGKVSYSSTHGRRPRSARDSGLPQLQDARDAREEWIGAEVRDVQA